MKLFIKAADTESISNVMIFFFKVIITVKMWMFNHPITSASAKNISKFKIPTHIQNGCRLLPKIYNSFCYKNQIFITKINFQINVSKNTNGNDKLGPLRLVPAVVF